MTDSTTQPVAIVIQPAAFVTVELAAAITGLTASGIRGKIAKGVWVNGEQYAKAPDDRIYINIKKVEKWVVSELQGLTCAKTPSASRSRSKGNNIARPSS